MGGLCDIYRGNVDCPVTTHIALFIGMLEIFDVDPFLRNMSKSFLLSLPEKHEQECELPF